MPMAYPALWLVVMILFIILEFVTYQYVSIWFALGSVGSFILSLFKVPFGGQVAAFFILTVILLIVTRPIVKKLMSKKPVATNADRIIGEIGVVLEEINNIEARGYIVVLNQKWTARSETGEIIPKGEQVRIERIEGVKAIVTKKEN